MSKMTCIKHGITVSIPASMMQKAGNYHFVLHFIDNHSDKYKDHKEKPALEVNVKIDAIFVRWVKWEALFNEQSELIGGKLEPDQPTYLHTLEGGRPIIHNPLPNWQRVFPDQQSLKDQHRATRSRVLVKVQVEPRKNGILVWLRSFDVDDPSSPHLQFDPKAIIDLQDTIEPDKFPNEGEHGDNRGTPKAGRFYKTRETEELIDERTIKVLTDEQGIATVVFEVTMKPGDNFRIVATIDQKQSDFINIAARKRVNDGSIWFVEKDPDGWVKRWRSKLNDDTQTLLPTKASPVLTVWRHLWVEVDSMGASPKGIESGGKRVIAEDDLEIEDVPDPPLDALIEAMDDAYVKVIKMPYYNESKTEWRHELRYGVIDQLRKYGEKYRQSRALEEQDFWVVYVVGIYELGRRPFRVSPETEEDDPNDPAPCDPDERDRDNDPDHETAMNGITLHSDVGEVDYFDYSFVAYEQIRNMCVQRLPQGGRRNMDKGKTYNSTVAHEIGHQCGIIEHSETAVPEDLMWVHRDDGGEELLERRPWRWKPEDIHGRIREMPRGHP